MYYKNLKLNIYNLPAKLFLISTFLLSPLVAPNSAEELNLLSFCEEDKNDALKIINFIESFIEIDNFISQLPERETAKSHYNNGVMIAGYNPRIAACEFYIAAHMFRNNSEWESCAKSFTKMGNTCLINKQCCPTHVASIETVNKKCLNAAASAYFLAGIFFKRANLYLDSQRAFFNADNMFCAAEEQSLQSLANLGARRLSSID